MTVNLDAVREDLQRHAAGHRGSAADCIAHLPGLLAEVEELRAANANLIRNAAVLADEVLYAHADRWGVS